MTVDVEVREFVLTITATSYYEFIDAIHAAHQWAIENGEKLNHTIIDESYTINENADLVRIS